MVGREGGDDCPGLGIRTWGSNGFFLLPPSSLPPGFPDALEFLPFGDATLHAPTPTSLQGLGFFLLLSAVSFTVPLTAFHFLNPFSEVISNHSLDLFLASFSF